MKIDHIHSIAAATAVRLGRSMLFAWPGGNGRGMHEKNATAYFAHELMRRGFHPYYEAALWRAKKRDARQQLHSLDLLALNADEGVVLTAESKNLFSTKGAPGLVADVSRMNKYLRAYKRGRYDQDFEVRQRIGVALAITNKDQWAAWWRHGLLDRARTTGTELHWALAAAGDYSVSSHELVSADDADSGTAWRLLVAVFDASGPKPVLGEKLPMPRVVKVPKPMIKGPRQSGKAVA